jgi:two-component system, cell cycle response regulator
MGIALTNQREPEEHRVGSKASDTILVMLRGRSIGRRTSLRSENPIVVVGRDPEANVCIPDESASRHHCRFELTENGWFIEDLKSTNGTYVGEHPIDRARLSDGDLITIGSTIFRYLTADNIEAAYHEEVYRIAIIDGLTQVYNRRYLEEFIDRELSRCQRHDRPMTALIFDVDGFKQLNAQFGHLSGDYVLRTIGAKLGRRIRREEIFARSGSDEFFVLLPETEIDDALKFAEIIRHTIEVMEFKFDGWKIPVTVSIGVGRYNPNMSSPDELLNTSLAALERAKSSGRNQVSD